MFARHARKLGEIVARPGSRQVLPDRVPHGEETLFAPPRLRKAVDGRLADLNMTPRERDAMRRMAARYGV